MTSPDLAVDRAGAAAPLHAQGARAIWPLLIILAAAGILGALVPQIVGPYWVSVATTLAMWIALTESWLLLSGFTGYISLGHAAFVGVGAYVMVLTWGTVPIWVSIVAAGGAAGALALLVGIPCLRVRGPYFVILTLGVSEFVKYIVINIEAGLGKFGRLLLGAPDSEIIFQIMVGLAAAAYVLAFLVRRSKLGFGLRAVRENETAAEMTGVPVTRLKVLAFVLSAVIPGAVGCLVVMRGGYFEPLQVFNPFTSLTIIAMSIIGGTDNERGPLLGVVFLVALSELLWTTAPELYMVILGVLLVVFVLQVPDGLYGRLRALGGRTRA